ncbi:hypothetical protein HDR67_01615 [bacterium]|nr:hypothetical protein [bacterium]
MLEYLFNFMKHNIILIFVVVMFLGIASIYSKKMKLLFLSILGMAGLYFALLCLYRLGIGIEGLYVWSCKVVIFVCEQIDYYNILCLNRSLMSSKLFELFMHRSFSDILLYVIHISILISFIILTIDILLPRLKLIYLRKINFNNNNSNKNLYFSNTIIRTQYKYIFYSVLRC